MSIDSLPSPPSWALHSISSGTLIYPESSIISFTNVLLIDTNTTIDFETIYRSVNASTFPVLYSHQTSGQELLDILSAKVPAISRLGLCFSLRSGLAEENLFVNSASFVAEENIAFVVALLNQFSVANIDYLACSSLESSSWSAYYAQIIAQTSAQVGASNDKTGNIRYGGDWVMESTGQDVEAVYFTREIQNYQFLLDTFGDAQSVSFVDGSGVPYGLGYNFRNQFCNQPNSNGGDPFTFCNIYAMVLGNLPAGKKVASVSSHGGYSQNECVLSMTDNSLYSTSNGTFVPLALPDGKTSAMIAISYYGIVSLMTDGTLYVKGWVTPAVGFASAPTSVWNQMTLPAGKSAAYVFCVPSATAVVMTDGTLYAYGTIIGLGSDLMTATQIVIPNGKLAKYAFATPNEICVLTTDGLIYYRSNSVTTLTHKELPSGNIAVSMAIANWGLYVLDLSKNLYAIGYSFPPGVGLPTDSVSSFAAMNSPSGEIVSNIQASGSSSTLLYAVTSTGYVYAINSGGATSNNSFQLGQGNQTARTGWVQVKASASTYVSNIRKLSTNITIPPIPPVITSVSPGIDASGNNTLLVYFDYSEIVASCIYTVNGTSYTTSTQLTSPIVIPASQLTLPNGSSYTITLAVSNGQTTSSVSAPVSTITYSVPGAPTGVSATANGIMTSTVSWTAPTNLGVPSLNSYQVSVGASSAASISFTNSTTQFSSLPTNQYTFLALSAYSTNQLLILGPQSGSLQYARINEGNPVSGLITITATGLPDTQFTGGAINSAGTRMVVSYGEWANTTNKIYWADTTNILNKVSNNLAFTQIADTTIRNYFGMSMTADGSMFVVAAYSEKKIYYSTWNGTNYSALTLALTCDTNIFGVALSKDGTKLFYSYDANTGVNSVFWVPITNGTTFGTPVAIGYPTGTGFTRTITCSDDGSLIFVGTWTNVGTGQYHGYAYWTGAGYSQIYNIPTGTMNNTSNGVVMAMGIDSGGNLYYQPYNLSSTILKATFNYTPYTSIASVNYDASASPTSLAVGPLLKNTTYTFSVKARNIAGYSASSATTTAKTANIDAPGSPTISSSSAGNGTLTFTFAAPAYTGTPSLTGYYYTLNDGSSNSITLGTYTITKTGLLNQAYVVKVYATNGSVVSVPATVTLTPYLPPNPPTIVSAVGAVNSGVITFTDGSANGAALTTYKYSLNSGEYNPVAYASFTSPYTISGLTPGSYYLRLRNVNVAGESTDATAAFFATGVPDAPFITGVSVSDAAASVFYTDISNGFPLTSVWYTLSGGAFDGTVFTRVGTTTSPFSIFGLTNGTSYNIYLKSANVQGNSAVSAVSTFAPTVPQAAPNAPTITGITSASNSLVVAFTPGINTGSPIIGYKYSTNNSDYYLSTALPSATSLTVPNLINAASYTVYIKAVNGSGDSVASNSMSGTPKGVPSAPTITSVSSVNSTLIVSYIDGSANGSAISGYAYSLDNITYTAVSVSGGTFTLSSPTVLFGSSYNVYMKSQNENGDSLASNKYGPSVVYAAPIAPVLGAVTATDGQLSIAFTQASNGYPVLRYEWAIQGGAWDSLSSYFVASSVVSPIVISGLTNAVSYTIYLRTVTGAGTSSSVSTTGTPLSTSLTTPIITSVVAGNESVSVSYSLGNTNGEGYSFMHSLNGAAFVDISAANPLVISGLTNATPYTVALKVKNGAAISSASAASSSFIPGNLPTAPTITNISTTPSSATISFTVGTYYSSPILGYKYSKDNGNSYKWAAETSSPITIYDISAITLYNIKLAAITSFGTSTGSAPVPVTTPQFTLNAPIISAVVPGNATVAVYFVDGASTGLTITAYRYSVNGGSDIAATNVSGGIMTISTGLTNGTSYTVRIKSVSYAVVSSYSNTSTTFIPTTVPAAPTITGVTAGDRSVSIAFTASSSYGYSILGYEFSLNGTDYFNTPGLPSSPIVLSGLTNGTAYTVRLKAFTQIGKSAASSASSSFTPYSTPSQPTIASVVPGNQQITVSVTNGSNNGRAITSYKYSFNGSNFTTVSSNPFTVSNLTNGSSYNVYVISTNASGDSPVSVVSSTVVPYGAPGAPSSVVAYPANRALRVEVSADNMNGGNLNNVAITGYKYSFDGTNFTYRVDTSSNTFTTSQLLSNGASSRVYVKRISSFGDSVASAPSNYAVSGNSPDTPSVISIVPGDKIATLTFTDGSANGSDIIGYKYSFNGTKYFEALQSSSPVITYNLTNGTPYTVYFKSYNAIGDSEPYIASSPVIPYGVPFAPVLTRIVPGNGCAYVYFNDISNNGSAVSRIRYSTGAAFLDASGLTSPLTIPNLTNGGVASGTNKIPYSIYIDAENSSGFSSKSNTLTVVPGAPLPPTILSIVAVDKGIRVFFVPPASTNGSPIIAYYYSIPTGPVKITGTASPLTINNLVNGTTYTPRLIAQNGFGASIPSDPSGSLFPYGPPLSSGFSISSVQPGYNTSTVMFSTPNNFSNGSPIIKYMYNLSTESAITWRDVSGLTSPITIHTPINTKFKVKLTAFNLGGQATTALSAEVSYSFLPPVQVKLVATPTVSLNTMRVPIVIPASINSSIVKYSYSLNDGNYVDFSGLGQIIASTTTFNIDISNNVNYKVKITATNAAGASPPSALMANPVQYVYLPPATGPTISNVSQISVSGNVVSGTALAIFAAPPIRNAPITSYVYTVDTSAGVPIAMTTRPVGTTIHGTITGISNVVPHTLYIYAVTPVGLSNPSISKPFTISYNVPSVPVITSATTAFRNTSYVYAYVSINAPVQLNGSPVSTYYYSLDSSGTNYTDASGSFDISGTKVNMTINNIPIDVSTNIIVSAVNGAGRSAWSVPYRVYYVYHQPDKPVIQTFTSTSTSAQYAAAYLRLTAPASNGSPITTYYYSTNNGSTYGDASGSIDISGTSVKFTVPNIPNDVSTNVVIAAANSIGRSPWSNPITVFTKYGVPSAINFGTPTITKTSITIPFTHSAVSSPAITSYTVSRDNGNTFNPANTLSSPIILSGLTANTNYTIIIRATNLAGSTNSASKIIKTLA